MAIICVVAGHCIPFLTWDGVHSGWVLYSLMPNSTVFFVFIAGFLFQHLSGKFEYRDYIKKKSLNVLLPYLVLSLLVIMVRSLLTHDGIFDPVHLSHWSTFARTLSWALLTGGHTMLQLWFIPMIALFYLLAPALLWADRDGRFYRLLPVLLAVTILVHRPANTDHILQSCAYFLPVYIYGMWFSRHHQLAMSWHGRWLAALLTLVTALTWLEVDVLEACRVHRFAAMFSTEHGTVDTNAVQKLLLCGVLLVILRRFDNVLRRRLSYLAEVSFGIFFLHGSFIKILNRYLVSSRRDAPTGSLLLFGLAVTVTLALSMGCVWLARNLLGRYELCHRLLNGPFQLSAGIPNKSLTLIGFPGDSAQIAGDPEVCFESGAGRAPGSTRAPAGDKGLPPVPRTPSPPAALFLAAL